MRERIDLSDQFKQAIRDAIDIVDVASDVTKLEQRGNRWVGLCPFHQEKTPSFSVDPERDLYYCFGCGAGGDAIGFYMETSGEDFVTAMETLAQRYGVPIPRTGAVDQRERAMDEALLEAERFFKRQLERSKGSTRYLEQRRIPPELIESHGIGFAPDEWRSLTEALEPKVGLDALIAAGLVGRAKKSGRPFDRFRNRLMFPIHNSSGHLVGFGGRTLGDDRAKYINTAETRAFQKKHLLYGLHRARRAIRESGRIVLVEGYFDVIAAVAAEAPYCVASMGTSLTTQQIRLLEKHTAEVVLGYDGDRAGNEACRKVLPELLAAGLTVRRARFPAGQDPDSLRLEVGSEAVLSIIEEAADALVLELDRLPPAAGRDAQGRAKVTEQVRDLLAPLEDPGQRSHYTHKAAERLGISERALEEILARAATPTTETAERALGKPAARRSPEERSMEEAVLAQLRAFDLAQESSQIPALPDPDVFYDKGWRWIYRRYRELCLERETDGAENPSSPLEDAAEEFVTKGSEYGIEVDRYSRLLVVEPPPLDPHRLASDLRDLTRRWGRDQTRLLRPAIQDAERAGDTERLNALLEKQQAFQRLRFGPREGAEEGRDGSKTG